MTFKFKNKSHVDIFIMFPVLTNVDTKNSTIKDSKGVGVYRHNDDFISNIDDNDELVIPMGCGTCSPKRIKRGAESKLLNKASMIHSNAVLNLKN